MLANYKEESIQVERLKRNGATITIQDVEIQRCLFESVEALDIISHNGVSRTYLNRILIG